MTDPLRLLLVDDDPDDEILMARELCKGGLTVTSHRTDSRDGLLNALRRADWHLVITDYSLRQMTGLEVLSVVKSENPLLPVILLSGTVGEEVAVESIKAGANDYLLKQNLIRLVPAVKRAIREADERQMRLAFEKELTESQQRLATIYNTVSDFLVFLNRTPDSRWLFTSYNRAFVSTLSKIGVQLEESELIGRDMDQIAREQLGFDEETVEWLKEFRQDAIQQARRVRKEREFQLPNGNFICEFTFNPITDSRGETQHLLMAGRDVTEQRRREEQERHAREQRTQSQKLEALGTMAGGIAHDFNNLLTGILGFADLILIGNSQDEMKSHANEIVAAATRARDLVLQILTFSRRTPTTRQVEQLTIIVRDFLPLIAASFPKTIELAAEFGEIGPFIHADTEQIQQVLLNLCSNAAYAMKNCGRLTIKVEEVYLDETYCRSHPPLVAGQHARLSISDTGTGIPPELISRVFEPFFTNKPIGEGTGLGLSVAHGIVQDHQGAIEVHSVVDQGTTIVIHLPTVPLD